MQGKVNVCQIQLACRCTAYADNKHVPHDLVLIINLSRSAPGLGNILTPMRLSSPEDPNLDLM